MNNPHNVYLIAKQCYNCHTVPNEKLVNVGGHQAGSKDFELVAWSQGMVRHNFLRTGGTANAESTAAQLRVMYVVGVMTDLEYSLRAVAAATQKAAFGVASAERAVRMKRRLIEIQQLLNDPLIQPALDAVATVELRANNREALVKRPTKSARQPTSSPRKPTAITSPQSIHYCRSQPVQELDRTTGSAGFTGSTQMYFCRAISR